MDPGYIAKCIKGGTAGTLDEQRTIVPQNISSARYPSNKVCLGEGFSYHDKSRQVTTRDYLQINPYQGGYDLLVVLGFLDGHVATVNSGRLLGHEFQWTTSGTSTGPYGIEGRDI